MLHRRMFLAACGGLLPGAALAQATSGQPVQGAVPPRGPAGPGARDGWFGSHWDSLAPEQRRQAEERFGRGMHANRPTPEEMRERWESMTPGQRRETMLGHGRGPHHARPHGARPRPG